MVNFGHLTLRLSLRLHAKNNSLEGFDMAAPFKNSFLF